MASFAEILDNTTTVDDVQNKANDLQLALGSSIALHSAYLTKSFEELVNCKRDTEETDCSGLAAKFVNNAKSPESCVDKSFAIAQAFCNDQYNSFLECLSENEGLYGPCARQLNTMEECLVKYLPKS